MNLRDQMALDVQSTFLCPDEFATVHNIDGRNVRVLVESDQEGTHIYNAHPPPYAEGVSVVQIILYADPLELGYRPEQDQSMRFDGFDYLIAGVADEMGLFKVTLERNKG